LGARIPSTIRKEVIRDWLNGLTREEIANKNQIGAGTVSSIVNECRQAQPDIDLLREVAVNLRRNGWSLGDFASSMRLRTKMAEWGITEDTRMEDLIEAIDVHCFKAELPATDFVEMVHRVASLSNSSKIPLDKIPSKILEEEEKLKSIQNKVHIIQNLTEKVLSDYRLTRNDVADYKNNKPLIINENKKLRLENEILRKDVSNLRRKNDEQYMELCGYGYDELISEHELKKLDSVWPPNEKRLSVKELHEIAHEIYRSPSRYTEIIKQIRENRNQKVIA
jgi:regulator of replication initiation timing